MRNLICPAAPSQTLSASTQQLLEISQRNASGLTPRMSSLRLFFLSCLPPGAKQGDQATQKMAEFSKIFQDEVNAAAAAAADDDGVTDIMVTVLVIVMAMAMVNW